MDKDELTENIIDALNNHETRDRQQIEAFKFGSNICIRNTDYDNGGGPEEHDWIIRIEEA